MHSRILIIMGVASCGKSTVGALLAQRLGLQFLDADTFHSAANKQKMKAGIPLADEDRWPWLNFMGNALAAQADKDGRVVGACSALKRSYRNALIQAAGEPILFVHLHGSIEILKRRIAERRHEFMNPSLLASQFAILEPPQSDENFVLIPVELSVEEIVSKLDTSTTSS